MDYYQGVVQEYLTADRRIFVSPEYWFALDEGPHGLKGRNWFIDILAIDLSRNTVTLCEVTFSKTAAALMKRLREWSQHWPEVRERIAYVSGLPDGMTFEVRVFTPGYDDLATKLQKRLQSEQLAFQPTVTKLEEVAPWRYKPHQRDG